MPVRGDGLPFILPKRGKKDLPVREEFEYNPIGSFRDMNPYDVAFCYPHPLYHRPFIVKGGHRKIQEYLKKLNIPMVVHHTLYRKGNHRTIVEFYGVESRIYISRSYGPWSGGLLRREKRYELVKIDNEGRRLLAEFKRVPRRWIRELNLYLTTERRSHVRGIQSR